ncbi:hypothetical protein EHI8A_064130 [Entamoeba histolytica HM-1:IMSS-B]|uniref:SAM domain-containing protein n=4 Tax=Entamoeba histolytica TaxID=5759 RepID=C4MAY4_ENTH1|nr:hypothetical protein EHI_167500 [Entamoeba histolytica HM-1:IMSS]EAL48517.2 hypothetical protein EHI_167500 [Entamoeba histolytica HM-1:IMSS]EMH72921.1 hypothetical protein EHI8A_064130 [Entamoeba histolytica HM-1:IMSS-B]ENY62233.1 hypothetical protein EHI7A_061200 [Entamoeba histolytica HM-1:IMSS-A]GAT99032.1 hypothetical protein CL6EHI_167500 [Entamoeba histolytica]|eukprot:XP_653903.2 hypothetical protein EHI_167500 [Entamoeba histolytica HM-1:IMSS]
MQQTPNNCISLKEGAKQKRSSVLLTKETKMPELQKINQKNIPILYVQTKTTILQPITILYNHDSNETLASIKDWLSVLAEIFKANIVAWEYPGYTKGSHYSDEKTANHIEYVWKFITKQLHQSPSRIVLYGKGAGCGPTLYLAHKIQKSIKPENERGIVRLAGIILINAQVEKNSLCFSCVTLQQVKKITAPIIFISSTACNNREELLKLTSSFQFTRGIHFLKSDSLDFEDEKLDEMCYRLNKFIITLFPEYKDVFNGNELQKRKPAELFVDPIETVRKFLKRIGLEQLTEQFIGFGYLSVENILSMDQIDIDSFGFSPEISKKLAEEIKKERLNQTSNHSECSIPLTSKSAEIPDLKKSNESKTYLEEDVDKNDLPEIPIEVVQIETDLFENNLSFDKEEKSKEKEPKCNKSERMKLKEKYRQSLPEVPDYISNIISLSQSSEPFQQIHQKKLEQVPKVPSIEINSSIKELSSRRFSSRKAVRLDQKTIKKLNEISTLQIQLSINQGSEQLPDDISSSFDKQAEIRRSFSSSSPNKNIMKLPQFIISGEDAPTKQRSFSVGIKQKQTK